MALHNIALDTAPPVLVVSSNRPGNTWCFDPETLDAVVELPSDLDPENPPIRILLSKDQYLPLSPDDFPWLVDDFDCNHPPTSTGNESTRN